MNSSRLFSGLVAGTLLVVACDGTSTTQPSSVSGVEIRAAKATAASYTPIEIGTLPGDVESYAPSVNNFGHVIVSSTYFSSTEPRRGRWFIRVGSQNFISPFSGTLSDVSNGALTYVTMNTEQDGSIVPAISTFNTTSGFSSASILDYAPGAGGSAKAVSDAGQVAGTASSGAIWNADGTRIDVANVDPATFEAVLAKDINNTGDALFEMHDNNLNHNRAYLRTSDGTMILLSPLAGHVASRGSEVSEVVNDVLYVAGTSDDRQGNFRAVRWVVNVATRSVVATHARADRSSSAAIADDGTVVGDLSGTGGSTPFVWRTNNTTLTLKAPKGLSSANAWSISGNGRYISGSARSGSYRRAVYWVASP